MITLWKDQHGNYAATRKDNAGDAASPIWRAFPFDESDKEFIAKVKRAKRGNDELNWQHTPFQCWDHEDALGWEG